MCERVRGAAASQLDCYDAIIHALDIGLTVIYSLHAKALSKEQTSKKNHPRCFRTSEFPNIRSIKKENLIVVMFSNPLFARSLGLLVQAISFY